MNTSLSLSLSDQRLIKEFNGHMRWLRQNLNVVLQKKEWGTLEDAQAILKKSREWYRQQRRGTKATKDKEAVEVTLRRGVDWVMEGNAIKYTTASIERLKTQITT